MKITFDFPSRLATAPPSILTMPVCLLVLACDALGATTITLEASSADITSPNDGAVVRPGNVPISGKGTISYQVVTGDNRFVLNERVAITLDPCDNACSFEASDPRIFDAGSTTDRIFNVPNHFFIRGLDVGEYKATIELSLTSNAQGAPGVPENLPITVTDTHTFTVRVPEPSGMALLLGSALTLLAARRR